MRNWKIQWCVDKSKEEIKNREEIMRKLHNLATETLTVEDCYKLRESLMHSNVFIDIIQKELIHQTEEESKKRKFFRKK